MSAEPAGVALQFATELAFRLVGTPGTSSLVTWSFGDGSSSTGESVGHTYGVAGLFTVQATAQNTLGSASASTSVTVRGLAGRWVGTLSGHTGFPPNRPVPIRNFELRLDQTPQARWQLVPGFWSDDAGCRRTFIAGSVEHPRRVTVSMESLLCNDGDLTFIGTLDASGNVIEGTCLNGGPNCTFRMVRQ